MQLSDLTSKTPEELNVMCAEALGWTNCKLVHNKNEGWSVLRGKNPVGEWADVPNYTGSWDAIMPEVRKLNGDDQQCDFVMYLTYATEAEKTPLLWQASWLHINASPLQLTIALILTLTSQH